MQQLDYAFQKAIRTYPQPVIVRKFGVTKRFELVDAVTAGNMTL